MPTVAEVEAFTASLACDESATTDRGRIDLIAALERAKGALAAAQARIAVTFDASQRAEQAAQGVPADKQGKGIAAQIALARQESPHKGGYHLGMAKALVHEMTNTLQSLATGEISERRAMLLVRETAVVSAELRSKIDELLAGRLAGLGDKRVAAEARKLTYQLDPTSVLRRTRGAHKDRRVSIRPAPDTMSYLTGFLPVAQGVAVHTALSKHADTLRGIGDPRSRGQIMADRLVELVTGQAVAEAVPTEVRLVMTDRALLGTDDTPARLEGYGAIPAWLARSLIRASGDLATQAKAWVRRLYTSPTTGDLVAMDSRRREFDGQLRQFLIVRDEACRTPWCDAQIRHLDHVEAVADGGVTSADNGQGLCEACNYAKQAPGWRATPSRDGPNHEVTVETPTGHTYTSTSPEPPGTDAVPA